MKVTRFAIPDLALIEPQVFGDARGSFVMTWQDEAFRREIANVTFIQDNQSRSRQWTLRGLHFQSRHTQGKLVRCSTGRVWDIAVDVRRSSATFGHWAATELSEDNQHQLWIPPGFAHGFLVLSEIADIQYKVTDRYDASSEQTISWNDPAIGIDWPIPAGVQPILSAKDTVGTPLATSAALP